jgi:hypothetical protein
LTDSEYIHDRFRAMFGEPAKQDLSRITAADIADLVQLDAIFGTSYAPRRRQLKLFEDDEQGN